MSTYGWSRTRGVDASALYQPGDTIHEGDSPAFLDLTLGRSVDPRDVDGGEHRRDGRALWEARCDVYWLAVLIIAHDDPLVPHEAVRSVGQAFVDAHGAHLS